MTISVYLCIYLLCLLICGYGVASWLAHDRPRLELFGMSACLGPAVMGLPLIAWSMAGHVPSRVAIGVITLICAISAMISLRSKSNRPKITAERPSPGLKLWVMLCFVILLGAILITAWNAFVSPVFEWDAFAIWQLKAKVLYLQPMTPRPDYFSDITLSYSHLRYPLLVPMVSAAMHALTGDLQDEAGHAPFLISFFGLCAVTYSALRVRRGKVPAITATTLLMTLPLLVRFATSGTAEMALCAFYGASLVCLLNWIETQTPGSLILCALFCIAMTWTKNEGVALAGINGGAILLLTPKPSHPRNVMAGFGLLAAVVICYLPWLAWSHGLPRTDEDYASHLQLSRIVSHLPGLGLIGWMTLKEMIYSGHAELAGHWGISDHWGVLWELLVLVIILNWRALRSRPVSLLLFCLVMQECAYILVYLITPLNLKNLLSDSVDRLVLHLTPAAALIIGMLWPRTQVATQPAKMP